MKSHKQISTDAIFSEPRLASIYDAFDSERDDLIPYVELVKSVGANYVIDLGCGTGSLALLLTDKSVDVLAVDPAEASVGVAQSKPGSSSVKWAIGDASQLPESVADMVLMVGNTAQAIIDREDWCNTLKKVRLSLKSDGYFVFETRNPEYEAWKEWNKKTSFKSILVPEIGQVDGWVDLTEVNLPLVSFRWTYVFHKDDTILTSDSTLVFRTQQQIKQDLVKYGFDLLEIRDAPDRPNKEYVVIAKAA